MQYIKSNLQGMYKLFIPIVFLTLSITGFSQKKSEADKLFDSAIQQYYNKDFGRAQHIALEVIQKDSTYTDAHVLLGT